MVDAPPGRKAYEIVGIDELCRNSSHVTAGPCLSRAEISIPPISFGQTERPDFPVVEYPFPSWDLRSATIEASPVYKVTNAVVHGELGIVTVGNFVIKETLRWAFPEFHGFEILEGRWLCLPSDEPQFVIDVAASLLCGFVGTRNYAHWWCDVVPALQIPPYGNAFRDSILLWPTIREPYQVQTLELLPEARGKSLFLGESSRVECRELRIVPQISDSAYFPHPFRLNLMRCLQERVGAGPGERRIYISRRDAVNRRLLNEEEVANLLQRNGFEIITLTGMNIADQIRLFSGASHIVAAHGAALANTVFCKEGAVLLELHFDTAIQWSMRRLASVRNLHYGCLVGREVREDPSSEPTDHEKTWVIAISELERVIRDPPFAPPGSARRDHKFRAWAASRLLDRARSRMEAGLRAK